nr:FAD-dependent oxidoreductase [uncultured Cetobacterium sp.]
MENKIYDLIIIGAGPAGLTAALYAGRANLSVLVIEKPNVGSLLMAHKVDNYPGVSKPTGKELYDLMKNQTLEFDVEYIDATFLGFDLFSENKVVKTDKENYHSRSIIIATGWSKNSSKKIPGEKEYLGKGVSYCATCDGAFTRNMSVSLVGKGEEVAEEALFLTKYSKEINIFVTSSELDCSSDLLETLTSNEKVNIFYSSELIEIKGEEFMEEIVIKHENETKTFKSQFAFLYLGTKSSTELYGEIASLDPHGYIVTDHYMKTNVEGVFAAGDVRSKVVRQVTTSTADGTVAAMEAIKFILKNKHKKAD